MIWAGATSCVIKEERVREKMEAFFPDVFIWKEGISFAFYSFWQGIALKELANS
ncbi:hypothetical protein LQE88_11135 [Acidaminococcus sp. NSJ-142]|jgi:hypothetical protein|uniref:hypothetical protein n=1 Tax=Acidaminococcus TaxID=904 RepID=UPI00135C15FA|nr:MULTISPECIES: hypothetical protein [Acidaminococcus]MCD2436529.1 hypothetical protein [Acidaminococcus hominis]MCH4096136.1 hypothetical protein [Acidaminococcus provencensis]